MAEDNDSHIGEVVLSDAHHAAIAALEAEIDGQRDQIHYLTSVVDEFADVKENAMAIIRRLAEKEDENEMLQSELDDLQQSYDDLLDEMVGDETEEPKGVEASKNDQMKKEFAAAQDDARRTINDLNGRIAMMEQEITRLREELLVGKEEMQRKERELEGNPRTEESKRAEVSKSHLGGTLNAQVDQIKKDFAAAQDDAQKTIDNLNDRITSTEQEIAEERYLREEREEACEKGAQLNEGLLMGEEKMQEKERELRELSALKSEVLKLKAFQLSEELLRGKEEMRRKDRELEVMSARVKECIAKNNSQTEELKRAQASKSALNAQINQMKDDFATAQDDAQTTINNLNDRITSMEHQIAKEWYLREEGCGKIAQLVEGLLTGEEKIQEKERELRELSALKSEVLKLKAFQLSEELLAGKEEIQRKERELEGMSAWVEECNAKNISQTEELKRAEVYKSHMEGTLDAQIDQMQDDYASARDDAQKTIDNLNDRITSMEQEIAKERCLREEACGKVAQLNEGLLVGEEKMQEKERESKELSTLKSEVLKLRWKERELEVITARVEECNVTNNPRIGELKRGTVSKSKPLKQDMADAVATMEDKDQDKKQQTEGRGDAEKSRELHLEVERLTAHAEEFKAIANNESERNRTLQSDLERVTSEKEEAMKCISNMEGTIDQLKRDMSDMMTKMLDQGHEGQQQIQEYEEAEKSGKLQSEVERLIAQVEEHETAMDNCSQILTNILLRGESSHSNSELTSEIEELSGENVVALKAEEIITHDKQMESLQPNVWVEECKVAKADKRKENRILQLDLEGMTTENDRESNLRNEAFPGRVEPENKINNLDTVIAVVEENARRLESKIDQLNQDTVATDETSKSAMEDNDQESRQLISRMEEYTMAASHEAEHSRELQMELERANARVQGETAIENGLELNRTLRSDLEQMTSARGEFSQSNSVLKRKMDPLSQERSDAEKEDTIREVHQLNVQVERHDVARLLQLEVKRMAIDKERECRLREEALREKDELEVEVDNLNQIIAVAEEYALELESKIDRLHQEIGFSKDNAEAAVEDKNQRLKQLDAQVDEYKMAADNAASLNKTLRIDLDLMTSERDEYLRLNSEMKQKTDQLSQHLAVAEKGATVMKREDFKSATNSLQLSLDQMASERDEALRCNSELNSKVDRLGQEMDIAEKKANEAMKDMQQEIQQLKDQIIEEFKASTELQLELQEMASKRDEALQCNHQLKHDIDIAKKKANEAMKDKDEEIQQLKIHMIEESKGSMDTSNLTIPVKKRGRRPLVAESRRAGGSNDESSVHSNGSLSSKSSHHQANGRLGSLFSRLGSPRNVAGLDMNPNECSKGIVGRMDQTKNDPKMIVSSDTEITEHIKHAMEEVHLPLSKQTKEGNVIDNIASLEVFANLPKEKDEHSAKITTLQAMVEDLELTVSLQATQNKILKEELSSLQDHINGMETHEPTNQDNVEQLKARTSTLEPIPQLWEDK